MATGSPNDLVDPLLTGNVNSHEVYASSGYNFHPDKLETMDKDEAHKNSLFSSVFSFVCTTVGAGVLALPSGLAPVGWTGVVLILLVSIGCTITARWLISCMFAVPGRRLVTYEDIGEAALGMWGRRLVTVVQLVTLIGIPSIFLILCGLNMNALIDELTMHEWVFIFGGCLIPIAWLKTMKEIALLAYLGVTASMFVAGLVIVRGLYVVQNGDYMYGTNIEVLHDHKWFDISGLAVSVNTIVFGFGGHSVIPNIVNEMKYPQENYRKFSAYSYLFIGSVYTAVAAIGYAAWGSDTGAEFAGGNVLNNISFGSVPPVVTHFVQASRAIIVLHVVMAYPIPLNPVSLYFEKLTGITQLTGAKELSSRIILRTLLVLITVFVASVVPFFPDVLSLVSALSLVIVAFVFPPVFYYLLYHNTKQFELWELILMGTIMALGCAASGVGCYYAIKALIDDVNAGNPFGGYF